MLEALYRRPRHQQIRLATTPHKDPLNQVRAGLIVEASCEVGDSAEHLAVRSPDVLASHLAKREHPRIMPLRQRRAPSQPGPAGRQSLEGEGAADVLGVLTEVGQSGAGDIGRDATSVVRNLDTQLVLDDNVDNERGCISVSNGGTVTNVSSAPLRCRVGKPINLGLPTRAAKAIWQ